MGKHKEKTGKYLLNTLIYRKKLKEEIQSVKSDMIINKLNLSVYILSKSIANFAFLEPFLVSGGFWAHLLNHNQSNLEWLAIVWR